MGFSSEVFNEKYDILFSGAKKAAFGETLSKE
jgi:hypothetical protein